jgi:catechol 2,3-dioxygenase-like lactoylglutathione lyase family enzyme
MPRGIDHIVHVVRDLDAARETYERLGFIVGAENVHPWGTRNRLVQFADSFIELLAIPEPNKLPRVPAGTYSFGNFNREFLDTCGEGLSFLVLQSSNPQAEKECFDKAGFGGFEVMDFSRKALRPDGLETEVSFSLAFARDPQSKHAGFFTCLQKTRSEIWFPELQRHENGATAIGAAVFVAENPTDHYVFFEAFVGVRNLQASSLGLRIETGQGEILVYDPRAFRDAFGIDAPRDEGLRFAAIILQAADPAVVRSLWRDRGFETRDLHGRVIVNALGTVIAAAAPAKGFQQIFIRSEISL